MENLTEKPTENLKGNLKKVQVLLASVSPLMELLQAHLSQTNGVTEAAALAIMERHTEIEAEATQLLASLEDSKERSSSLFDNAQTQIRQHLEAMDVYQRLRKQQIQDDGSAIQIVVGQVAEMKPLTSLIRKVTMQTNILAFNAGILAAKAGGAGSGFTVVAEEMRKLAQQVETAAVCVEESIATVSKTVEEKVTVMVAKDRTETEARLFSALITAMTSMSGDFKTAVGELHSVSQHTYGAVHSIHSAVLDVLEHAQFQDITRQQIEQVQNGLSLCDQRMVLVVQRLDGTLSEPLDIHDLTDDLRAFRASYTMQAQLTTHHSVISCESDNDVGDRPAIELF